MPGIHRIRAPRGPGGAIAAFAGASGVLVALAAPASAAATTTSLGASPLGEMTGSGLAGLVTTLAVAGLGGIVLFARNRRTRHRAAHQTTQRPRSDRGRGDR